MLLTDRNGVAIDYVGEQALEGDLKRAGLYLGSVWSEEHEGTNGVGTCIVIERPLTVFRDDHFKSRHIGLTCTVCPIFDPAGELTAVLDISALASQARESQAFAQHLVSATAQRIEHALFLEHFREAWIVRLLDQNGLADPDGINLLALDADRRIVGIDGRTRRRGANAFIGRSLAEVFETGADPHMLRPNEGTATFSVRSIVSGEDYLAIAQPPRCLRPTRPQPRPEAPSALTLDTLAQGDPRMAAAVRVAERVMNRNIPIILHGETGSGKEVFAKAVHLASDRASRPFVAVNCASIPETLIESELFGYTPGAFTGANRQGAKGKIAESDGGTLFLDEIGDMPDGLADPPAARAGGKRSQSAGRRQAGAGSAVGDLRYPSQSARAGGRRAFPRGPVLPPERRSRDPAAAARPHRYRHSYSLGLDHGGTGNRRVAEP